MRVPDNAATGVAKVTVSFPGWKEGNVAPTIFEVPIAAAKPAESR